MYILYYLGLTIAFTLLSITSPAQSTISQNLLTDSIALSQQCTKWLDRLEYSEDTTIIDTLHKYEATSHASSTFHRSSPYLLTYSLGEGYQILGDIESAFDWHFKAQQSAELIWGANSLPVSEAINGIVFDLMYLGKFSEALVQSQKVLEIRLTHLTPDHSDVAQAYNNLGVIYRYNGNLVEAIEHLKQAVLIWENQDPLPVHDICAAYSNAASNYARMGNYQKAISNYEQILIYKDSIPPVARSSNLSQATVFNNMAVLYRLLGDYGTALSLYQQSIGLELQQKIPNNRNLSIHYDNISKTFSGLQMHDSSLLYIDRALELKKSFLDEDHILVHDTYMNKGMVLLAQQHPEEAIPYLERALKRYKREFQGDHRRVAILSTHLGRAYALTGKGKEGLKLLEEGIEMDQKVLNKNSPALANNHLVVVNTLFNSSLDTIAVFDHLTKALQIYLPDASPDKLPIRLPQVIDRHIIPILGTIGKYYFNRSDLDSTALEKSWKAYMLAVSAIDSVRNRYRPSSSKEQLLSEAWPTFEGLIQSALKSYQRTGNISYLHQALQVSEKSRAMIFRESIKHGQAKKYANIPQSLWDKEEELKQQLIFNGRKISQALEKPSQDIRALRMKQFSLQRSYDSLLKIFELDYPDYYKLRYSTLTLDIPVLQQYLSETESDMLEFFVGEDQVYVFLLRPDTINLFKLPVDQPLDQLVDQIRSSIVQDGQPVQNSRFLAKWGYEGYD